MVQKPDRGRYLILEDVRVSYNYKKNSINLTSSDPDIPNGAFHMVLNKGTETEEALRDLLSDNGLIKSSDVTSLHVDKRKDVPFQQLSSLAQELASDIRMGTLRNLALIGSPGCGKSYFMRTMAHYSTMLGSTVVYVEGSSKVSELSKIVDPRKLNVINLEDCDGIFNPLNKNFSEAQKINKLRELMKLIMSIHITDEYYHQVAMKHIYAGIDIINVSSNLTLSIDLLLQYLNSVANNSERDHKSALAVVKDTLNHIMSLPNANLFFKDGEPLENKIKEGYTNIINLEPVREYPRGLSLALEIEYSLLNTLRDFTEIETEEGLPLAIFIDGLNHQMLDKPMFDLKRDLGSQNDQRRGSVIASYHDSYIMENNAERISDYLLFGSHQNEHLDNLFPLLTEEKIAELNKMRKSFSTAQAVRVSSNGNILAFTSSSFQQ